MRRIVTLTVALVVVGAAGGGLALRWAGRGPSRPSLSQAINRYRKSSTVAPSTHGLQPPAGVYVYRGSGHEHLSFMDTRQSQGPEEPGTVSVLPDGCWSFEMNFNSYHSQSWIRCAQGSQLREKGGTADQQFDFIVFSQSEHSITTCTPPFLVADTNAKPGTVLGSVHCTVHSRTTNTTATQTGTVTFVGPDTVTVGGSAVPALHSREQMRLSQGQTGTVTLDIWFATSNGLPLQEQHHISVVSPAPSPLNHVTYTEDGEWTLTSLAPQH